VGGKTTPLQTPRGWGDYVRKGGTRGLARSGHKRRSEGCPDTCPVGGETTGYFKKGGKRPVKDIHGKEKEETKGVQKESGITGRVVPVHDSSPKKDVLLMRDGGTKKRKGALWM